MRVSLLVVAMSLLATCRTTPPPPPPAVSASALEDHAGDATETAIEVPHDAKNGGVDFENEWIFNRFGRFRRRGGGTGVLTGRRYNVVKIDLPSGEQKTVYFDVTENWNSWTPSQ